MSIEQHVEELRAELKACLDAHDIDHIKAELAAAEAHLRSVNRAFDEACIA